MSEATTSKPIISLEPLGGTVRTSPDGRSTFLDVTFKCDFSDDSEPVEGTSISIEDGQLLTVVQLAQTAYLKIGKLLADQQRNNQLRE